MNVLFCISAVVRYVSLVPLVPLCLVNQAEPGVEPPSSIPKLLTAFARFVYLLTIPDPPSEPA